VIIKLVNIEGKLFQTEKSQQVGDHFEQQISISNLHPSMFILQIEQDGKVYSTPFVKAE